MLTKKYTGKPTSETVVPFVREVDKFNERGFQINRKEIQELALELYWDCHAKATEVIPDETLKRIANFEEMREYIGDLFGWKYLTCFENNEGEVQLEYKYALIMYHKLVADGATQEELQEAEALVYFLCGHHLLDSISNIRQKTTKNMLYPRIRSSAKIFGFVGCPEIHYNFASRLYTPKGYKAYYYTIEDITLKAVEAHYKGRLVPKEELPTGSLFYPKLPKKVENNLLKSILRGDFNFDNMTGNYLPELLKVSAEIEAEQDTLKKKNMFTEYIQPIMLEMLGLGVNVLKNYFDENGFDESVVKIYHIGHEGVGYLVQEDFAKETVFGEYAPLLKEVDIIKLEGVLEGAFL